jgi:hypothetical protein
MSPGARSNPGRSDAHRDLPLGQRDQGELPRPKSSTPGPAQAKVVGPED